MDLRDQIAEVITAAGGHYDHADADTITDAVMGVVTSYLERRRAYADRRVKLAREAGRREGMAELVAHLEDVAAGARAGKSEAYPDEAERMGPTRWCLATDRAHRLAERYADGQGVPVPDATARAKRLEAGLEREQHRHASEMFSVKAQAAGQLLAWQEEHAALETLYEARGAELAKVKTSTRRRELVLVDRLRRRGDRLRALENAQDTAT